MDSNQKVEETRPPLKFNFTYWEGFPALYTTCIHHVYTMYTMLVSGIISSTGLATVENQILDMFNVHNPFIIFFNFLIFGCLTPSNEP